MFYEPAVKISRFLRDAEDHPKVRICADDRTIEMNEEMTVYRHTLRSIIYVRNTMALYVLPGRSIRGINREYATLINRASFLRRSLVNMGVLV